MKWEYAIHRHDMDGPYTVYEVNNALEIWLNGWGLQGWELVQVETFIPFKFGWIAVFKRAIRV